MAIAVLLRLSVAIKEAIKSIRATDSTNGSKLCGFSTRLRCNIIESWISKLKNLERDLDRIYESMASVYLTVICLSSCFGLSSRYLRSIVSQRPIFASYGYLEWAISGL